jgi:AcrR family transcriptional regulator
MARPRLVSDEAILGAVRAAVVEQGPHVSLDVVAERLGVTAPALFRRFHSRHDLLLAALKPEPIPPVLASIDKGPDDRPIETQLEELFTHASRFFAATIPCLTALRESGIPVDDMYKGAEQAPLKVVGALTRWLESARARRLLDMPDAHTTALAMLGALQAPAFLRHLTNDSGPWDATQYARPLAQLYLRGLSPSRRAATARVAAASRGKKSSRGSIRSKERT